MISIPKPTFIINSKINVNSSIHNINNKIKFKDTRKKSSINNLKMKEIKVYFAVTIMKCYKAIYFIKKNEEI